MLVLLFDGIVSTDAIIKIGKVVRNKMKLNGGNIEIKTCDSFLIKVDIMTTDAGILSWRQTNPSLPDTALVFISCSYQQR